VVGLALVVVATVGYMAVEGYGWVDAVYMTVITLGTVGFGEVHPLGTGGRFLTIAVIIAGFAILVYAGSVLTKLFASGELSEQIRERRERKMRDELHDHVIVAGYGRVGQAVARSLRKMGRPFVVLDPNPEHAPAVAAAGAALITGDATDEDDLARAGLDRAAGLVAATDRDATNLVVVLTARALRPDLRIVTRVNETRWVARMENAGADVAQSPYDSYGASLAASAVTPAVVDLHNLPLLGLATEEIVVDASSRLIGKPIAELLGEHIGVYVLGLRREQQLHRWHEVTDPIREGDIVLVLGTPAHLAALSASS
jgi:voltage-gated potassium channel